MYRLEDGTETEQGLDRKALMGSMLLENPEAETRWYFRYFLGQAHSNFVTKLTKSGSLDLLVLSVLEEAVCGRQGGLRRTASGNPPCP